MHCRQALWCARFGAADVEFIIRLVALHNFDTRVMMPSRDWLELGWRSLRGDQHRMVRR